MNNHFEKIECTSTSTSADDFARHEAELAPLFATFRESVSEWSTADFARQEAELKPLLSTFRESVTDWSDNEISRERKISTQSVHPRARWIWATACGSALAAAIVGGFILMPHTPTAGNVAQNHPAPLVAAPQAIAQADEQPANQIIQAKHSIVPRKLSDEEQRAQLQLQEEDQLFADVNSYVAQQSPSALEPLASLMNK